MNAIVPETLQILGELGFNDTEALVYCELLRAPGSTGYRVAQSLGKAQASAYAALAALETKGAVMYDDSETRAYRAVPPGELLGRLRKKFDHNFERANQLLESLEAPANDTRIYQLRNVEQVYERVRTMLSEARETVVFELFPGPIEELREDLVAAAGRGVRVAGLVLRPEDAVEGVQSIVSKRGQRILEIFPGQQITVVVDAAQFLVALLDSGGQVQHGMWTANGYLAFLFSNGIVSDVVLHGSDYLDEIGGSPNKFLFKDLPPGYHAMMEVAAAPAARGRKR
jgi:HTH-type transcriptional regulator, sugar sensing transcriptional regulator